MNKLRYSPTNMYDNSINWSTQCGITISQMLQTAKYNSNVFTNINTNWSRV